MNDNTDRRRFWRAAFQAEVQLVAADGCVTPAELLDISLKGALVKVPQQWSGSLGDTCRIDLRLADDAEIAMRTVVAHVEGAHVGLRCENIDLDSITHLRRLVELNSGDAGLLERELTVLLSR